MMIPLSVVLLSLGLISLQTVLCQDEPVSALIERGNDLLSRGRTTDALSIFSSAIEKDNQNYLTYFKRATTYLAMSRHSAALSDFDKVLQLKPGFSAATAQRGKVLASLGQWDSATEALNEVDDSSSNLLKNQIGAARKSAAAAEQMLAQGEVDHCMKQVGAAISVASASSHLRLVRAKCQILNGDAEGAVGDLVIATRLNPSDPAAQLLSAYLFFFAQDDTERALQQIKACLHYDPDAKACKTTFRSLRKLNKTLQAVKAARDAKTWTSAKKALRGTSEEPGLLAQLSDERDRLISESVLSSKLHLQLISNMNELACEVFAETKESSAMKMCDEALSTNANSVVALRSKASVLAREELYEDALQLLNQAMDAAGGQDRSIQEQIQKTQRQLKISKQKDYYKILGVDRDADTKTIKKKYRQLTKQFHPDKYHGDLTKEQVVKKIEGINEAYEVLSTPELRQRFDNGDDPNAAPDQQHNPFAHHGFQHGGPPFFHQGGGNPFAGGSFKFSF